MTEPVADPELELQRQYNIGNYLLSLENAGRVASRVQDIELYGLAPDFYKTYAKRMAEVQMARGRGGDAATVGAHALRIR